MRRSSEAQFGLTAPFSSGRIAGRALVRLLAMLIGCCLFADCFAQASERSDVIVLRMQKGVWGIPDKEATDIRSRANRAVFEYFHRTHPHIRIIPAGGVELQGTAAESGFLLSMAGDTAPDILYVNFRQLDNYLKQNFLYPLDEYLATPEGRHIWARVHPIVQREITIKGHVYSVPWMQYVMALYYRRDLFKAAGLNPDKPPTTWDELLEYARKLTVPSKRQKGMAFNGPTDQSWYWVNFLWQAGAEVFTKGLDGKTRAAFNTPEGVKALEFWRRLHTDRWRGADGKLIGPAGYIGKDAPREELEGRVGMWMSYSSDTAVNLQDMNLSNIGVAALPAGPAGKANEINAGMWGINNTIRDKRRRDACWEFIRFMGSDDAARVRTGAWVDAGLGKVIEPQLLEKFGYHEYLSQVDPQWVKANKEAFRHGHPEPHGENSQQIYHELDLPLQAIIIDPKADPMALLNRTAEQVNTLLLGVRPPGQLEADRTAARITLGSIVVLVAVLVFRRITWLKRNPVDELPASRAAGRDTRRTVALVWLFMLPALAAILVWAYFPLLRGLVIAFQNYKILGGSSWVGMDNFIEVFRQERFWRAVANSVFYVAFNLGIGFFVPIVLAIMLSEVPRAKMFFRTVYYLPAVTSALVTVFLWQWFYDPSSQGLFNSIIGMFNNIQGIVHISEQAWLGDPKLALLCVVIPSIWAGAGPGSIIYLAALKTIPDDLYEAADLDGANVFQKIRHIVLPGLKPLIIINLVGAFIGAFKAMENIFVMTGGGPLYATHTLGLEIWYNAFTYLKFGYATAAAWMMGAMLVGFTMLQLRFLLRMQWGSAKV